MAATSPDKKRLLLIAGETASFIGFLVGFILCLLALTRYTWYNIVDFITLPEFAVMIVFLVIFLTLPVIARIAVYQIKKVEIKVRMEQLSQEILAQLREKRQIDVDLLAARFQVNESDVESQLDHLVETGDIRGTYSGGTFTLQAGFEVLDERTRRLQMMKKNFLTFVQPYRFISLKKIAANFKVSIKDVEDYARELITSSKIRGFIDGESANLVREISSIALDFTDLPECPYCDNKVLENARYCSTCGKPIKEEPKPEDLDTDDADSDLEKEMKKK